MDLAYRYSAAPGARRGLLRTLRQFISFRGQRRSVTAPNRARLKDIQCPTLVITGEKDHVIPADYVEAVNSIARAEIHNFRACGHYPHLELSGPFSDLVTSFVVRSQA